MADWIAVAKVVNDRMSERGISQRELSELSGVSVATLRQIQQGSDRRRSSVTLAAISRALGFPNDHLRRVAANGHNKTEDRSHDVAAIAELHEKIETLHSRVAAIEDHLKLAPPS